MREKFSEAQSSGRGGRNDEKEIKDLQDKALAGSAAGSMALFMTACGSSETGNGNASQTQESGTGAGNGKEGTTAQTGTEQAAAETALPVSKTEPSVPEGASVSQKTDVTAAMSVDFMTMDPMDTSDTLSGGVQRLIMDGLFGFDDEMKIIPLLAESYEANEDATEFTFHLRPRAQWSDGTPLTAQDFVFGITRALSSSTGAVAEDMLAIVNARAYAAGEVDASALGVVAEDDHTLVIRLEKSNPDFPSLTAGAHYMPCNQDYFQSCQGHYGLSSEYLITNGPFTFASIYAWQTDSGERSITVTRSETYRGERKASAASVTYLIDYDEAYDTDPVAALSSGEVDIAALTAVQAQAAEEAGCGVLAVDDAVTGLLLNPQSDKLENTQLRSLFFKTLDRADLLSRREGAVEAQGIMADCVLWDGEPYYSQGTQAYTPQDLEATQELPSLLRSLELDEMPSITVICLNDEESINVVNGMLVAWNSALGNAFNLEPLSASQFQARIASGNYEAALYTLRAGAPPPMTC